MRVVVLVPAYAGPSAKLPVLIAMHGRGEAKKGPDKGARGWIDDYWLPRAVRRLIDPPLTRPDLLGHADKKRLARLNESIEQNPYEGLIVACPYTPDTLRDEQLFDQGKLLADFLVDELIPKLRRETPASEAVGVDGVSLGGRASIVVGLARPEAFRVVGSLQAAFDSEDAPDLARRAKEAVKRNPKLTFRLLTSDQDFYLDANRAISRELTAAGVSNTLTVVPGPHAYEFNRGPGVFEMLLRHDRLLRGAEAP